MSTAAESPNDSRTQERSSDDDRVARHVGGEIDRELDGSFSARERPQTPRAIVQDVPAQSMDTTRSDPPQQHVPRLQELEREIEERHEREHDDRER